MTSQQNWTRPQNRWPGLRTWNLTPKSDTPSRTLRNAPKGPRTKKVSHCIAIPTARTRRSTNRRPPKRLRAQEPRTPEPLTPPSPRAWAPRSAPRPSPVTSTARQGWATRSAARRKAASRARKQQSSPPTTRKPARYPPRVMGRSPQERRRQTSSTRPTSSRSCAAVILSCSRPRSPTARSSLTLWPPGGHRGCRRLVLPRPRRRPSEGAADEPRSQYQHR